MRKKRKSLKKKWRKDTKKKERGKNNSGTIKGRRGCIGKRKDTDAEKTRKYGSVILKENTALTRKATFLQLHSSVCQHVF